MGRKSYFDLIAEMGFDADKELKNLNYLLRKPEYFGRFSYSENSIEDVLRESFLNYKGRQTVTSFEQMQKLIYSGTNNTTDLLFTYSECLIDMFKELWDSFRDKERNFIVEIITPNIERFLNLSNHELIELEDGREIIVEKNAYASEVSQIISANNIQEAIKVLEYNHFANKGNLSRKREILKSLADYLEPLRKELNADGKLPEVLRSQNKKIVAIEKLFEMYNNLGVRHNNDKQYSKGFSEQEMEEWYDDIYTSTLFVILSLEESRIISNLDELKQSQLN